MQTAFMGTRCAASYSWSWTITVVTTAPVALAWNLAEFLALGSNGRPSSSGADSAGFDHYRGVVGWWGIEYYEGEHG
ncbi:hypothetical protein K469DRAFT_271989 [Zopfia rhizophila CBS 207.26]|uniref:Uncharacterized protein n=1 Tax=Zopfia rhizophila CBS 207.26 TaxID=1314779 RepID=A0A6A6DLT2_9PEZI|nr:hypothetical protein K469DRAFT_271989 [Zopfia rhizophila CBS 207.26]